jgi:hypothetical protein
MEQRYTLKLESFMHNGAHNEWMCVGGNRKVVSGGVQCAPAMPRCKLASRLFEAQNTLSNQRH